MLDAVDLSHLTPEERKHISEVLKRQKDEEEKDKQMLKALRDEFEEYKSDIKSNAESMTVQNGTEDIGLLCSLCHKTKIAEGSGHVCPLCKTRFCSRCGGRINAKVVWICNVCRKRQELQLKSGERFNPKIPKCNNIASPGSEHEKENVSTDGKFLINNNSKINGLLAKSKQKSENSEIQSQFEKVESDRISIASGSSSTKGVSKSNSPHRVTQKLSSPQNKKDLLQMPAVPTQANVSPSPTFGFEVDLSPNKSIQPSEKLPHFRKSPEKSKVIRRSNAVLERFDSDPISDSSGMLVVDSSNNDSEAAPHSSSSSNRATKNSDTIIRRSSTVPPRDLDRNGYVGSFEDDDVQSTDYSSIYDYDNVTTPSECGNDNSLSRRAEDGRSRHLGHGAIEDYGNYKRNLANSLSHIPSTNPEDSWQERPPVNWQPSADNLFLIGRVSLSKNSRILRGGTSPLGLKVVGGKSTPSGRLAAFITKVRKGSLADTVGHLKPGDEIISWNGHCLQDASFHRVYDIVSASKSDPKVELVVSRPIRDIPRIPGTRLKQTESSVSSMDSDKSTASKSLLGKLEIKILYDKDTRELRVTALRAVDLPPRENGLPRNPYLKMYLWPDRSITTKMRTKTLKKTLNPNWSQTFVYENMRLEDVEAQSLDLTLWDVDQSLEAENKFMGEIMVDLGLVCLDNEPHWFHFMPLGVRGHQRYHARDEQNPSDTLSMRSYSPGRQPATVGDISSIRTLTQEHGKKVQLTKRKLPSLPKNINQTSDEDATDISSLEPTELDLGESPSLSHSHHGSHISDVDSRSVDQTLENFVGCVGPGQVIDRQALAMSPVGEISIGLRSCNKFVVQVLEARGLTCRPYKKVIPTFSVKINMIDGLKTIAKKRTKQSQRSLSPVFQDRLVFELHQVGTTIQVILYADYGRMDKKSFIGSAQISLLNLKLSERLLGCYKLFPTSSVIEPKHGPRQDSNSSFCSSSISQF